MRKMSPTNPVAIRVRALACLVANLAGAGAAFATPSEQAVKAGYLFKLPPFVDWPANAFASPTDPFRLCVVGEDPFGPSLDQAGRGQSAGPRPIAIFRLKKATPDDHCQLMFISGDAPFISQSLTAVSGTPVLTVTDEQSGDKGVVNFIRAESRVRLEIDQLAASRNHLKVSSKLLDVAISLDENAP